MNITNNPLAILTICFVIWLLVKGPVEVADVLNKTYYHLTEPRHE